MIFVTGNDYKFQEAQALSPVVLQQVSLDLDEIQSLDVKEVVKHKVIQAFSKVRKPVIVDDVSLEIEAWSGFPGPLIKWVNQTLKPMGICRLMQIEENRRVCCREVLGWYDGERVRFFEGKVWGQVALEPLGDNGFGFDSIFIPEGQQKTYAQMSKSQKNKVSHRGMAWKNFRETFYG